MAAQERETYSHLRKRLLNEYSSFEFFAAVSLCEVLASGKRRLGETLVPAEEAVRFSASLGFQFPPSDISGLKSDDTGRFLMEVPFLGLIGPSGVLPHWFHELALDRKRHKDHVLSDFLDLFHHRIISLFYLAWKKPRFTEHYERGATDRLSGYLLSLIGLGTPHLTEALELRPESLIFCAGLLSRTVPSAETVEKAVAYFSGTRVKLEQFVERLLPLDPEDQTQLGAANSALGVDAMCGSHIWDVQSFFHIDLGPVGWNHFVDLLPSGTKLRSIFALVRYIVGIEYEFDVRIFLKRQEVPGCSLGDPGPGGARLGWSTWIKHPDFVPDRDPFVTFQQP